MNAGSVQLNNGTTNLCAFKLIILMVILITTHFLIYVSYVLIVILKLLLLETEIKAMEGSHEEKLDRFIKRFTVLLCRNRCPTIER